MDSDTQSGHITPAGDNRREDAVKVANTIDVLIAHIEARGREIAARLEREVKGELKRELLREEIAKVRNEIASLCGEMKEEFARLEKKLSVQWLITLFVIILLNQNAIETLARLFGLVK